MRGGRIARRAAGAALVVAAFAFLSRAVAQDWGRLRAYQWHVELLPLLGSVAALLLVFCFGVLGWSRAFACLDSTRVRYGTLLRIWFLSNLARYVPGKVWQFVGAAQLARSEGIPAAVLLTSLLANAGFTLLGAMIVAAATLPAGAWLGRALPGGGHLPPGLWLATSCTLLSLVLVHPLVLNWGLRLVPRWLHRTVLVWNGRWVDGVLLLMIAVVGWIAYGAALLLFVRSLFPPPAGALAALTGANAAAFAAGYVVIIAPAGLGARELSMAALLRPILPEGVAVVVAVGSRLWIVAAELVGAGLALVAMRRRR